MPARRRPATDERIGMTGQDARYLLNELLHRIEP